MILDLDMLVVRVTLVLAMRSCCHHVSLRHPLSPHGSSAFLLRTPLSCRMDSSWLLMHGAQTQARRQAFWPRRLFGLLPLPVRPHPHPVYAVYNRCRCRFSGGSSSSSSSSSSSTATTSGLPCFRSQAPLPAPVSAVVLEVLRPPQLRPLFCLPTPLHPHPHQLCRKQTSRRQCRVRWTLLASRFSEQSRPTRWVDDLVVMAARWSRLCPSRASLAYSCCFPLVATRGAQQQQQQQQ